MTEEIKMIKKLTKEKHLKYILSDLQDYANEKFVSPLELADSECELLLNYITNLQKENEKLKDELYSVNQVVNELLDIQSRNEKAVEYLKSLMDSEVFSLTRDNEAFKGIDKKQVAKNEVVLSMLKTQTLLNILEGGDE